jgi:hypothetical protein
MAEEETPTQTIITTSKSLVPEPGYFDGNRKKFDDWWRSMVLYLRSNKIDEADQKITAVISRLRGGTAGIYAQGKLEELEENDDTSSWTEFEDEMKKMFGDLMQTHDAEHQIETLKQGKEHIADFMIKFQALKVRARTDEAHAIFLLKKNVRSDVIKTILGYPASSIPKQYDQWTEAIMSVAQGYESTESRPSIPSGSGIIYGGAGQPMDIGRQKPAFNKSGQPKCFKCNYYGHMAKDCRSKKSPTCYNCDKPGHIAKNCREPRKMRVRSSQEEGEKEKEREENGDKKKDFVEGSE